MTMSHEEYVEQLAQEVSAGALSMDEAAARSRQDLHDRLDKQCRFRFSLREGKLKPW